MNVEVLINNSSDPKARYVTWSPSPCTARVTDPAGATGPVTVTLRNRVGGAGGQVVFHSTLAGPGSAMLNLVLPLNGSSVVFFIAGRFGHPSIADRDTVIEARVGSTVVARVPLMVRIRKNANKLSAGERDRFVAAMAALNNQGAGRFVDFRDMHTEIAQNEAHGAPGFLSWHRAYLLDLERELQAIDPSVALPYWRFDRPAPAVFSRDFLGVADQNGTVQFGPNNPLQFWVTDGHPGVDRSPHFKTASGSALQVITETQTIDLGTHFAQFTKMEGNPHGVAHTSFDGFISSLPTAAKDPLFFLLHANVDRLWAKWQRRYHRYDQTQAASFDSNLPTGNRIGHNLADTMWPWNGVTSGGRPPTAPGGGLASSPCTGAPGPQPRVRDALDYRGIVNAVARLGFDYDDVRYV